MVSFDKQKECLPSLDANAMPGQAVSVATPFNGLKCSSSFAVSAYSHPTRLKFCVLMFRGWNVLGIRSAGSTSSAAISCRNLSMFHLHQGHLFFPNRSQHVLHAKCVQHVAHSCMSGLSGTQSSPHSSKQISQRSPFRARSSSILGSSSGTGASLRGSVPVCSNSASA